MKRNEIRAPRLRQGARLRNDTRSLLRSRPLQALFLGVAAMQASAVASGGYRYDTFLKPADDSPAPVVAQAMLPVEVVRAPKLSELALAKAGAADKEESKSSEVRALAEKYRARGYKVSDILAEQIHEAAVENDIAPEIAFGLVRTESGFKNSATSPVGAIGLTQLMPATARWMKPGVTRSDLRDSETNLSIGFRYLRELIDKYEGDTELALLAYNRGPGTVDRVLKRGGDPDNGYADMVMGRRTTHR
ncbi:MAG TPA: lytic transglycosylase domain-containing protein [Longimicrobium sp.]|nr:lytic transglycosylase domain-containing protein [Longimicrobium sp.]